MESLEEYLNRMRFAEPSGSHLRPPDPGPPKAQRESRIQYLKQVKNLRPDVLQSLQKNVQPVYARVIGVGRKLLRGELLEKFEIVLQDWRLIHETIYDAQTDFPTWLLKEYERIGRVWLRNSDFHSKRDGEETCQALWELQSKLLDWTREWWWFHRTDWWYNHALQTLNKWEREGIDNEPDWLYELRYLAPSPVTFQPFFFGFFPFVPDCEPWGDYEKALTKEFEKATRTYRDRVTKSWASTRSEELRLARTKREVSHFKMLVEFHFNKRTQKALSVEYGYSISHISEALRHLCNLLPVRYKRNVS